MSGRVSAEMLEARRLLRQGYTAYAAAKETGLNQSSISRCKVCRQIIKEVKEAKEAEAERGNHDN
jgi:uncharacterized protein YerC